MGGDIGDRQLAARERADLADLAAVAQVLGGDRNAFSAIVERHSQGLFRYAWRLLGDRTAAEEVTQEVLARAFSSLGKFRGECAFQPWLYRILLNLCRDQKKAGRSRESPSSDPTAGGILPTLAGNTSARADDDLDRKRALAALEQAIEDLPQGQREVVVMRLIENQSYEAISETLGLPVGAVKVRVHRARHRLKEALGSLLNEVLKEEAA